MCGVEILVVHLNDFLLMALLRECVLLALRPVLLSHPLELLKHATIVLEQLISCLEVLAGDRADELAVLKPFFDRLADRERGQVVRQLTQGVVVRWTEGILDDVMLFVRILVEHGGEVGDLVVSLRLFRRALLVIFLFVQIYFALILICIIREIFCKGLTSTMLDISEFMPPPMLLGCLRSKEFES